MNYLYSALYILLFVLMVVFGIVGLIFTPSLWLAQYIAKKIDIGPD